MADVKWIKITTDIFDDEKILLIESLPDAYAIITVWFKLLCLAGKQNNSGVFLLGQMPYTDSMLATIFRMKEATVTMALKTFEQFHMVEIIDGVITIPNWNKHQTLDSYEKKKERDRLYQAERRANQKALISQSSDKSSDSKTIESSDVAFSDKDKEKEKNKEYKKEIHKEKKVFAPPSYEQVLEYARKRNHEELARKFFDYFEAGEWVDSKGVHVRNWKQKFITWENNNPSNEKSAKGDSFDTDEFFELAMARKI